MNARTIGYWATTGLLAFMMFGSGAAKIAGVEDLVKSMEHLGMPLYIMPLLGAWYIGAGLSLLAPGLARLKEWTYAGIVFAMTGAVFSHLSVGDPLAGSAPVFVILALAAASYVLRPNSRRLDTVSASGAVDLQPASAL